MEKPFRQAIEAPNTKTDQAKNWPKPDHSKYAYVDRSK
jgi:hypothetical protein